MNESRLKALALFVAGLVLFVPWLGSAPVHVIHDEVVFALNAHSIATSGQGFFGQPWPLYFFIKGNFWSTPLVVYFPALFQLVLPVSLFTVRLPTALLGALSVALTFAVGRQVLRSDRAATFAALFLATTPAFFIHSRLGVDHLYPIPLLLAAVWFALRFDRGGPLWNLAIAGALLGVGVYSYMAAVAMMPCYLALLLLMIVVPSPRRIPGVAAMVAGFAVPLLLLVWWLSAHPGQITQQLAMYGLATDASHPGADLMAHFRYLRLLAYLQVYHAYLDPTFLFFTGDSSLINSTRTAGVFLIASAVFLGVGVNAFLNRDRSRVTGLVLGGLLIAPLAAVMIGELKVNRALVMLPFAALIAAGGVESMLNSSARWIRSLAAIALIALTVQFAYFYTDYMRGYRLRTGAWFEFDQAAAFDVVLGKLPNSDAGIVLSENVPWVAEHWRLHLIERRREDLVARTTTFDQIRTNQADWPKHAIVVISAKEVTADAAARLPLTWHVEDVREPDGDVWLKVLSPLP